MRCLRKPWLQSTHADPNRSNPFGSTRPRHHRSGGDGQWENGGFRAPYTPGYACSTPVRRSLATDLAQLSWRNLNLFGLVLAPTRELAYQISHAIEALGSLISIRTAVIVGGMDMVSQAIALGKKPHIVVATPGRLLDHLENTKGFSLRTLKYLVLDEADRILDLDFGAAMDKILKTLPREGRRTYLFSATMTYKVEGLQRASLRDPLRVAVSASEYQTVATLLQYYVFIPHKHKDLYLVLYGSISHTSAPSPSTSTSTSPFPSLLIRW